MYSYSDIRYVHLEMSTRCNAACPGCPRNLCGVDILEDYPLHSMTLSEAKTIFAPDFLKQLHVILINGNLGDFVLAKDGMDIIRYFREQNPKLDIRLNTNASARPDIWADLAKLKVTTFFCLDGLKGTHELYRLQTSWDLVIKNAKSFIEAGGVAYWKMISFDHNQHEIEECRALSKELGFKDFQLVDHGRDHFPVFNQKKEFLHTVGNKTEVVDFTTVYNKFPKDNNNDVYDITPKKINCKVKTIKSVYITATGEVYPCCWLGFYPREKVHYGNSQIVPLLPENNNANVVGIEQAIAWFNLVEQSWSSDQLYICNNVCGTTQ